MDIITHAPEKVKPDFSIWQEKKRANVQMARRMAQAGYKKRAFMMEHCGDRMMFGKCENCGAVEIQHANLCRDRLCPICQWRLSRRLFAEMCSTLLYINDYDFVTAGFLTLTVKNCAPEDISKTLTGMSQAWNRMLADRGLKQMVVGWARSVEITYNERTRTFHPHYHVIVLFDDIYEPGYCQRFFNDLWARACKFDYKPITDFRVINEIVNDNVDLSGAIAETFKYAVKNDQCQKMPLSIFRTFVAQINGKRFQSYGGIIKKARIKLGLREEDDEKEISTNVCQRCGGELQKVVAEWSFTHDQYIFMINQ